MRRLSFLAVLLLGVACNSRVPGNEDSGEAGEGEEGKTDVPPDCWEVMPDASLYCGIDESEFPWGPGFHFYTGLLPEQSDGSCFACPASDVDEMVLKDIANECDKPIDKFEALCIDPNTAVDGTCAYMAYYWSDCGQDATTSGN